MLAEYKTKTNLGVGIGFLMQLAGNVAIGGSLGATVALAGIALFLWGCCQYAKGKGYSGWMGALGLLSIIGLIILAVIPDKHKVA